MNKEMNSYSSFINDLNSLPTLDKDENFKLIQLYQENKSIEVRNTIIEGNMRLVLSIALKNAKRSHLPIMDLIQEGSLGLISAVENYNPDFEIPFSSFASIKIQNHIYDYMTTYSNIIFVPRYVFRKVSEIENKRNELSLLLSRNPTDEELAESLGENYTAQKVRDTLSLFVKTISIDESIYEKDGKAFYDENIVDNSSPNKEYEKKEIVSFYSEAIKNLDERRRDILLSRAKNTTKKATLEGLSKKYHISKERVRQLEEEAYNSVRNDILKHF